MLSGIADDDTLAYSAQPGSPPKKSRLYKDPLSYNPHPHGHSPGPLGHSPCPPGHSPNPSGHSSDLFSPLVGSHTAFSGQENAHHDSHAPVLPTEALLNEDCAYTGKVPQGFEHTTKPGLVHQALPGAESIISRALQYGNMQQAGNNHQARLDHTAMANQQAGDSSWEQAVFYAQWDGLHGNQDVQATGFCADSRAGHYTTSALHQGSVAEPSQQLPGNSTCPGLSGLRYWEYPAYHSAAVAEPQNPSTDHDTASWLSNGQQQPSLQQELQQPINHAPSGLVFGDFSPHDLQSMQMSQQQDNADADDSNAQASIADSAVADRNDATAGSNNSQSWWHAMLGRSHAEPGAHDAGSKPFGLSRQVAQWSDVLLPGVVFATDWTAQHDAQLQHSTEARGANAPRDLLERRQLHDAKQKLA